jgi:hypothetical protein
MHIQSFGSNTIGMVSACRCSETTTLKLPLWALRRFHALSALPQRALAGSMIVPVSQSYLECQYTLTDTSELLTL